MEALAPLRDAVVLAVAASHRRRMRRSQMARSSLQSLERRPAMVLPPLREAKRVVLVRHGQSTWNAEGRIQGSSDFAVLTPKGESQAATSRQMLLSDDFDACFTSPLARSRRTAEIIWSGRDMEKMIDDWDLREIDLYSFQGLLKHEGKEKYGNLFHQWQKDAPNFIIDGHYPVRELWDRATSSWQRILAHEANSILVVAHNAVNQALVATALGLGTEYFRMLLQSNCGVSVLDFTPPRGDRSLGICLNRLNQTPNSPVTAGSSGGRKTSKRIILVCQGVTQNDSELSLGGMGYEPLNMLGIVQSQKVAELLLDVKVNSILYSPRVAAVDTATAISEVQEAADCLGADCVPRYVEMKKLLELEVEPIFERAFQIQGKPANVQYKPLQECDIASMNELWSASKNAWQAVLNEISDESVGEANTVVVAHSAIHVALLCHCLKLSIEHVSSFHIDAGSISVIDFPDGPRGRGVVRCTNYTAHLGRWSIPITRSTAYDEEF